MSEQWHERLIDDTDPDSGVGHLTDAGVRLVPGDHAKVGFRTDHPEVGGEWMWVEVTAVDDSGPEVVYAGELANRPHFIRPAVLRAGQPVRFAMRHVYDYDKDSPDRPEGEREPATGRDTPVRRRQGKRGTNENEIGGDSELILCADGHLAPAIITCRHVMNGSAKTWVKWTAFGKETSDCLCKACFRRGVSGLRPDDLKSVCMNCFRGHEARHPGRVRWADPEECLRLGFTERRPT
jgi:hypothetical protein